MDQHVIESIEENNGYRKNQNLLTTEAMALIEERLAQREEALKLINSN